MSSLDNLELPEKITWDHSVQPAIDILMSRFDGNRGFEGPAVIGVDSANLVYDFIPTAHAPAYVPALLGALALSTEPLSRTNRRLAIQNYSTRVGAESGSWMYVSSILADMVSLSQLSRRGKLILGDNPLQRTVLREDIPGNLVPGEVLAERIGFASPRHMMELAHTHNVESFILAGLCAASQLRTSDLSNPREDYRNIYGIEALFAPFAEIIGYDVTAIHERSVARVRNLEIIHGLDAPSLMRARKIREEYGLTDRKTSDRIMKEAMFVLLGDDFFSRFVVTNRSRHGIYFSELAAETGNHSVRGALRGKSEGSTAQKIKEDKFDPVDLYGIMLIVRSEEDVIGLFADVISKVKQTERMQYIFSQSRPGKYFKVQGSQDYIDTVLGDPRVKNAIGVDFDRVDDQLDIGGYHVCKLTFALTTIIEDRIVKVPFEVQIQTEAQREDSQIGKTSHSIREARERGLDVEADPKILYALKHTRNNRDTIGTQLWPASAVRGLRYRNLIRRTPDPGANPSAYKRTRK